MGVNSLFLMGKDPLHSRFAITNIGTGRGYHRVGTRDYSSKRETSNAIIYIQNITQDFIDFRVAHIWEHVILDLPQNVVRCVRL